MQQSALAIKDPPATTPAAPGEDVPAKLQFDALAPVGSPGSLKALLDKSAPVLRAVLPRHVTPERLVKTLLVAANRNPDILKCTQASVIETITRAGELGLDLSGTMGEAYPVPFNNKISYTDERGIKREAWAMQLQMIPGYRGLAKLARQSGEVVRLEAEEVHERDHFVYQKGSEFRVEFRPALTGERGKVVGYYAYAKLRDGSEQADFMTVSDVEKVRQAAKSKNSPAWANWFGEMGKKTVFRRLAKWLPLSAEKFQLALQQDNLDIDVDALLPTIETSATSRTEALVDRLAGGEESPSEGAGELVEGEAEVQRLTPEQVAELRDLAARNEVSWDEVEGFFEAQIEDLEGPDRHVIEAEVIAEIKKRGKKGQRK